MTKLFDLIQRGPNPAKGITTLVLRHYTEIKQVRALLWDWSTIAAALDLPPSRAKALRAAFARVSRGIATKTLEAPSAPAAPRQSQGRPAAISAPTAGGDDSKPSQPSTIKRLTL